MRTFSPEQSFVHVKEVFSIISRLSKLLFQMLLPITLYTNLEQFSYPALLLCRSPDMRACTLMDINAAMRDCVTVSGPMKFI